MEGLEAGDLGLCPVPPEQRPLRQYEELRQSWFFAWPSESLAGLLRPLAISWLLVVPFTLLVASGSWVLRHDLPRLVVAGLAAAIALPTLLLVRQWLGWSTVHARLVRERVDYE
ncbi:MAG: CGLD27 family protein, partial [Cyanobium sp.]